MGKKVLIFSVEPQKEGQLDALCDRFMEAQWKAARVEKGGFADKKINYCTGCSACRKKWAMSTEGRHGADSSTAWRRRSDRDGNAVYFYTMCAR